MHISIHPVDTQPDEVILFAESELVRYLAKDADNAPEEIAVTIVNPPVAGKASPPVHDGYCLSWTQQRLELHAAKSKGLLNGVYDILQLLGFAFPFPGQDRYPSRQDFSALKAAANGQWRIPSFRHRILHFDNMRLTSQMIDWIGKLKINMLQQHLHVFKADIGPRPDLIEMVRERGIELNIGGHGFDNWLPPSQYGREHPDWYSKHHVVHKGVFIDPNDALVPAEFSGGQICLSNPDVIQEFARNVVKFLTENLQIRTVSLWPNDGIGGWCTCPSCLALEPDPNRPDPQTGTPGRITSYLWFIKQVAQLVKDRVPDVRIEFAAFYDFATPPEDFEVIPRGDHYLGFLVDDYFGCLLHGHGEKFNRQRIEQAHRKWREVFSGEIYAVGYYADLCKIMDFPIVFTTKIREDFQYLRDDIGIDSVMTLVVCAELDYLLDFCFQNIYSFATLSWDHRRQSQEILRELAEGISASSSDDVFQYLDILDRLGRDHPDKHAGWIWLRRGDHTMGDWAHLASQLEIKDIISPQKLTKLIRSLTSAKAKARSDDVAVEILGRLRRALDTLQLMLSYDSQAPSESQLSVLDEIAQAVSRRGTFPAALVPTLEDLRTKAAQGVPGRQ